jgi:hypothetical protein
MYANKRPLEEQISRAFFGEFSEPSDSLEKQEKKGVEISLHSFGVKGK